MLVVGFRECVGRPLPRLIRLAYTMQVKVQGSLFQHQEVRKARPLSSVDKLVPLTRRSRGVGHCARNQPVV